MADDRVVARALGGEAGGGGVTTNTSRAVDDSEEGRAGCGESPVERDRVRRRWVETGRGKPLQEVDRLYVEAGSGSDGRGGPAGVVDPGLSMVGRWQLRAENRERGWGLAESVEMAMGGGEIGWRVSDAVVGRVDLVGGVISACRKGG